MSDMYLQQLLLLATSSTQQCSPDVLDQTHTRITVISYYHPFPFMQGGTDEERHNLLHTKFSMQCLQ